MSRADLLLNDAAWLEGLAFGRAGAEASRLTAISYRIRESFATLEGDAQPVAWLYELYWDRGPDNRGWKPWASVDKPTESPKVRNLQPLYAPPPSPKLGVAIEALRDIANSDDVDNALDPARNKRVAREALSQLEKQGSEMAKLKKYEPLRGPDSNRLDLIPEPLRSEVIKVCEATCAVHGSGPPCARRDFACYRCQDLARAALSGDRPREDRDV